LAIQNEQTASRQQLVSELTDLVQQAPVKLYPKLWRDLGEAGITLPQLGAMSLVAQNPRRVSDVAGALDMSLPSATSLLDRLEERGFIERTHDASDRRVVRCCLTPEGRAQLDRVSRSVVENFDAALIVFSNAQLETLVAAAKRLRAASKA